MGYSGGWLLFLLFKLDERAHKITNYLEEDLK